MKKRGKRLFIIALGLFLVCAVLLLILLPHFSPAPPAMVISEDEFMSQMDNIARDREWCGILPEFQQFLDGCEKENISIRQLPAFEAYNYIFSEEDFLKFFPMADSAMSITENPPFIDIRYEIYGGKALQTSISINKEEGRIDSMSTVDFVNSVQYYFKTLTGEPGVFNIEKIEARPGQ